MQVLLKQVPANTVTMSLCGVGKGLDEELKELYFVDNIPTQLCKHLKVFRKEMKKAVEDRKERGMQHAWNDCCERTIEDIDEFTHR